MKHIKHIKQKPSHQKNWNSTMNLPNSFTIKRKFSRCFILTNFSLQFQFDRLLPALPHTHIDGWKRPALNNRCWKNFETNKKKNQFFLLKIDCTDDVIPVVVVVMVDYWTFIYWFYRYFFYYLFFAFDADNV